MPILLDPSSFGTGTNLPQYATSGSPMTQAGYMAALNANINASNRDAIVNRGLTQADLEDAIAQSKAQEAASHVPVAQGADAQQLMMQQQQNAALYTPGADGSPSPYQSTLSTQQAASQGKAQVSLGQSAQTEQDQQLVAVGQGYSRLMEHMDQNGNLPGVGDSDYAATMQDAKAAEQGMLKAGVTLDGSPMDPTNLSRMKAAYIASMNLPQNRLELAKIGLENQGKVQAATVTASYGYDKSKYASDVRAAAQGATDTARIKMAQMQLDAGKTMESAAMSAFNSMFEHADATGTISPGDYTRAVEARSNAIYNDPTTSIGKLRAAAENDPDKSAANTQLANLQQQAKEQAKQDVDQAVVLYKSSGGKAAGSNAAIIKVFGPAAVAGSAPPATTTAAAVAAPASSTGGRVTLTNDAAGKAAWASAKSGTLFTTPDGRPVTKP